MKINNVAAESGYICITTQSIFTNWKPYQLRLQIAFGEESPLLLVHSLAYTIVLNPFPNRTVLVSLQSLAMGLLYIRKEQEV
ncbi:hypothetical protein [Brevibacillus laterosporus]|uniref:hypothetical protein n=1 Tax=Brevibacillus laterosporus TaxID=1465 RepID=UPI002405804A|nr:hypothetical protein [Brevibacillus laterosporus]